MITFGLTGGVGMGKTTAVQYLQQGGLAAVDTDDLARQVVAPGQPALAEICRSFGSDLTDSFGQLRRDKLANIVFADPDARSKLEAITHPRIRHLWKERLAAWRAENRPIAVVVIPLLFETRAESEFDSVICVACSETTQRQRLAARGWSSEQVDQRIAAQMPISEKMQRADFVVWTEGSEKTLPRQLERVFGSV